MIVAADTVLWVTILLIVTVLEIAAVALFLLLLAIFSWRARRR